MLFPTDFRKKNAPQNNDSLYDIQFDAILIQQSIAKQYGVLPAAQGEMRYDDWAKLVGGLMDDTPLGRVVAVRGEKDREVIRKMDSWQLSIRNDWNAFLAKKLAAQDAADTRTAMDALEKMIAKAFGGE